MKVNKYIYVFALLFLSLVSCERDELQNQQFVEEGLPALINLGYGSSSSGVVVTKGLQSNLDEDRVNSLRILVFDANTGDLVTDHTYVGDDLKGTSSSDNYSSGYVQLATTSGQKKIFGIANSVNNADFSINLDNVKNISDMENVAVEQNNKIIARGANFLMSGWYNETANMDPTQTGFSADDLKATIITIPAGNSTTQYKRVKLSRMDAKVEFVFATGSDKISFTPLSYAVFNVPTLAYLCGYDDETGNQPASGYDYNTNCFTSNHQNFDKTNSFGFYMIESNLTPKQEATTFAHRDLKDKGTIADGTDTGEYDYVGADGEWDGKWAYANDYSTYVQVKGRIEYKDGGKFISADVIYNIHLGNFGSSVSGGSYNDFSTRRNTHYTYTVTINGADDIRVEVENKNERMPAAEGAVVIADGQIFTVDSHYSSRLMTFVNDGANNTISADQVAELSWYISTPYSSGMPTINKTTGAFENFANLDYKWVEFYPTTSNDKVTTSYTTYMDWVNESRDGSRYYVGDLVADIKKWYTDKTNSNWPDADNLYVTAFVNEFYYDNGDANYPEATTPNETAMWKKVVNADDRYMHILCDVKHSVDGSSLSMGSAYSIFQHSIQTIYNTDPNITGLKVAWGTEMINEEKTEEIMNLYGTTDVNGRLYGQILSDYNTVGTTNDNNTSTFNGRYNTSLLWATLDEWSDKVKESTYGPVLSDISNSTTANPAVYACMTRNRDNDGDGDIDEDEIRWYLAAIDQYMGIHIGEQGVNSDARLYPLSDLNMKDYHYLSSSCGTYSNTWNNGTIFWAEEACSTGPGYVNWRGENYRWAVRCLRNLGSDTDLGNGVQHYSQIEVNADGTASVTSKYLNIASMRAKTYTEGEQYPIGDEFSTQNRPHVQFIIAPSNMSSTYLYSDVKSYIEDGNLTAVCPEGYRVPYGRELALMFTLIPSDANAGDTNDEFLDWSNTNGSNSINNIWLSATYSSFGEYGTAEYTQDGRRHAVVATGNGIMTVNKTTERGYIRCVKDNTTYSPQNPAGVLQEGGDLTGNQ